MKKSFYIIILLLTGAFSFFMGCSDDVTPSLYQTPDPKAAPVINSVEPADSAMAGVTVITINGSNFSTDASKVIVFFNAEPGQVLEATPTQLKVKVPNVALDSAAVLVGVIGTLDFSNKHQYRLTPAFAEIKKSADADLFTDDLIPYGITTDALGNIYVSVVEFSKGLGIKKISPSGSIIPVGELVDFAPKGGETSFPKLNMWQNNTIIAARRVNAIFEITEGVAAKVFISQGLTTQTPVYDIDFDQNQNVWAGGKGLFRVTPAKELKSFQYPNEIKSIRVFNNYVYTLTTVNEEDIIRRFPIISSDSLGIAEDIFNIAQKVLPDSGTFKIQGSDFEIAADGDIILGTTRTKDPIVVVHNDGSFDALYTGVIPDNTVVYAMDWGPEQYIYLTKQATAGMKQAVFKLDMQKNGAPHYGR